MHTLLTIPVELLYEIQLFATSSALPQTCKTLYNVFASTPPYYRAQYLVERTNPRRVPVLTSILRYPICTRDVLEGYFRIRNQKQGIRQSSGSLLTPPDLPRRLFRALVLDPGKNVKTKVWTEQDPPLPFLRYLYEACPILPPSANSHDGYALTKAVQVGFVPLVRFLLDHGASPALKGNLAVIIAIHRKDLDLVRILVERISTDGEESCHEIRAKGKGRQRDRVEVSQDMLRAAVKCRAQDIVEYFTKDKGCIPDMQTLLLMR